MKFSHSLFARNAFLLIHRSLHSKEHHPLIKFVGHRTKAPIASGEKTHEAQAKSEPIHDSASDKSNSKPLSSPDFTTLSGRAWHGRPKISEIEIDAILSGGASATAGFPVMTIPSRL